MVVSLASCVTDTELKTTVDQRGQGPRYLITIKDSLNSPYFYRIIKV